MSAHVHRDGAAGPSALEATEILAADESSSSSGASGTNESTEISDLLIEMLDPDSDVILFVGKERKMIWAYSNFLRAISPRFQEMLQEYPGPRYDDEKGLRPMCVKSLPDDDADSMTRLLRALSGVDPGMDEPKPREIQKIGELADKYAMVSRLTYAGSYWLRDRNIEDPADYWYLLIAAYNFRLREPFKRFSKALITRHGRMSSSLLKPATETPGTVSGFRLASIEERRHWHAVNMYREILGLCLDCFENGESAFPGENGSCDVCGANCA